MPSNSSKDLALLLFEQVEISESAQKKWIKCKQEAELKNCLAAYISDLLQNRPEELKNWLYRIDVPEQAALEAVAYSTSMEATQSLAQLIIDRQKQKIIFREKYKTPPPKESDLTL